MDTGTGLEGIGVETVGERIRAGRETRREDYAIQEGIPEVEMIPGHSNERRAKILNEATDLAEEAYNKLRAAIDTLTICDLSAQDKYAGLVRDMGKAVRDFSGKL